MSADPRVGLRIALNATAAVTGGGVTYWLHILPAMVGLGTPHQFDLFVSQDQVRIGTDLPGNFRIERIRFGRPAVLRRLAWEQLRLPLLLRRRGIDVMLAPNDIGPVLPGCPVVMAIRNPTPYYGPQGSTPKERLRERMLRTLTGLSAGRAAHVFFVSEDSRRQIAPILGLRPEKTSVVYHGISRRFAEECERSEKASPGSPADPRYILSVSAIRIHKDWESLLRAFSGLRREEAYRSHRLVIAGPVTDPHYAASLRRLQAELGLDGAVEFRGEVPYSELPALYRGSSLFVLPSRAETFGHPLVEAMASGVPVVSSDLDVSQEICGRAAAYFPAGDWKALHARMSEVLGSLPARTAMIESGRLRARDFSWERCARETLALLEAAARSRPHD